ncbi:MAG: hypothetical protein AAGD14_14685 [Planctomycetota bacterium]
MPDYTDSDLWRYLDGELPAATAAVVREAAQSDPALQARLDELRTISAAVLDGAPKPTEGFSNRVVAAALLQGATPPTADVIELRRFVRRALVAAAVLAAVGLGYLALEVMPELLLGPDLQAGSDPLLESR